MSSHLYSKMNKAKEFFSALNWTGSFQEYIAKVEADPYRHTRTAFQLIHDMLNHYGTEEVEDSGEFLTRYKLFDDPFDAGSNAIYGMERTLMRLAKYIRAAAREEGKERIFVLHGPVGTAKTSLLELIQRGLEEYSRLPEGEVHSFEWRLPRNLSAPSKKVGFSIDDDIPADEDVFATVGSQMHDHPLYLIPKDLRKEFLLELFNQKYGDKSFVIPHKILEGSLDRNNSQIFNLLMAEYNGDWMKVVQRVRVKRFHFSEIEGVGIAKILPEGNVETSSQLLTFDENFKYLAMILSQMNLVKYSGKYVSGNRGILHYSDIFKKPVPYLQHLLSASEEKKMDFGDVTSDIDVIIMGTTNIPEYEEFRKNPISKGLRSRMRKIDVPYLLRYGDERKIYDQAVRQVSKRRHVAPHTTETAALWSVLTRLEKSQLPSAKDLDESTKNTLRKFTPIVKAYLYNGEYHQNLNNQDIKNLTREVKKRLRNEFLYEGMDGVPTRIIQNLFADICEENTERCIMPFDVFRLLDKIIDQGGINYDFLNRPVDEGYHDFRAFVQEIKGLYTEHVAREVENSILNIDEDEVDKRIREYILHVKAYNNHEKIRNPVTQKEEDPDENMLRNIENMLSISDSEKAEHRFRIMSRAADAARKQAKLDIRATYTDLYDALRKSLYQEKKSKINWSGIKTSLEKIRGGETVNVLEKDPRRSIEILINNMVSRYGYCPNCSVDTALFFVDEKDLA